MHDRARISDVQHSPRKSHSRPLLIELIRRSHGMCVRVKTFGVKTKRKKKAQLHKINDTKLPRDVESKEK